MGRVVIVAAGEAKPAGFPQLTGVEASGPLSTDTVVAGEDRPIRVWTHELEAGAALRWTRAPVDHLIYVWHGEVVCDDEPAKAEGAVVVEHGARASLRATQPSTLVHFVLAPGRNEPTRAGGKVHAISGGAVPRGEDGLGIRHALFADAGCPSCSLWLHRNDFRADYEVGLHAHSEDEVIFIVAGSMRVGRRELGPGSALAIDRETRYGFFAGAEGVAFVNFRPSHPYALIGDGQAPIDEAQYIHAAVGTAGAS